MYEPKIIVVKNSDLNHIVELLMNDQNSVEDKVLLFFSEFPEYTQIHRSPFDFIKELDAEEKRIVYKPFKTIVFAIHITLANYKMLLSLDRFYNGFKSEIDGMFDGWFTQSCVYNVILSEESDGSVYCIRCKPYFGITVGRLMALLWNGTKNYSEVKSHR